MTDRSDQVKTVLITGAAGSSGRYLAEYLATKHPQVKVHGIARRKDSRNPVLGVTLHEGDLLDTSSLIRVIRRIGPDVIFHVAANPDKGFDIPSAILQNNLTGTANLFEAVRIDNEDILNQVYRPIVLNISSSEVYGAVREEDIPITEECPMRPQSPYAVSKMAADHLGRIYHKAYGMKVVTTRAFTYLNHLRPDLFASSFARQIALIEVGKLDVLKHGNLDSVRVILDARDIMHAYWLAATKCQFGEAYNIGGDQRVTVGDVLERLLLMSHMGIRSDKRLEDWCEQDPFLLRPIDVTLQVPDCSKFKKETGWEPKFNLNQSLETLLNYWRKEVRKID